MIVTLDQLKTSLQAVKNYISKIKSTITSVIAEEFDASSSYSAGDYVYYNGKLYKFTADHATGVFDGTDADEVTVTDEMVNDVTVNGTSVVNGGVANIPIAGAFTPGAIMVSGYGLQMQSNGYISTKTSTTSEIKSGLRQWEHISPTNQHVSTFYGLAKAAGHDEKDSTESFGTYTEEAKSAIQTMLGVPSSDEVVGDVTVGGNSVVNNGTAEIPILDDYNKYGLPKIGNDDSFTTDSNGLLRIRSATASQVKAGTSTYRALAPVLQHASTFYGLAKAAGADMAQSSNAVGTYTDEAKTAIKSMLGVRDGDLSIGTVSTLSPDSSATASITGDYNAMELNLGIPRGKSGVYVGATAPADPDVNVWIDTSGGDDFQAIVNAVYAMLPVAEEVGF